MSPILIGLIVVIALVVASLAYAVFAAAPKSRNFRDYEALSNDHARRTRAWDAAVARARRRNEWHG